MTSTDTYLRPTGLSAALAAMAEQPQLLVAGATDVFPARPGRALTGHVLDLTGVEELRGIVSDARGLRIGACVTWAEIAAARLPHSLSALQDAAREVGGRQIQNAGTIGGNLCNASPAADGVPPLLVLAATVELASRSGTRELALGDFIAGPRRTAIRPDEIMTAVRIPRAAVAGQSRFFKLGARKYLVISIASVAVRLVEREGVVADAAVAVGACSAVALRLGAVEAALVGQPWADAARRIDGDVVAAGLAPLDDIRASARYRAVAAAELLRRAVAEITGGKP